MQIFIDEFIAKIAEVYPPAGESDDAPVRLPSPGTPASPSSANAKAKTEPQPALTANLDSHAS
jgi:hypothetical protein